MHQGLLHAHSGLRWLVLALALGALGAAIKGLVTGGQWSGLNRKLNASFLGAFHLQVVLGLVLYVGTSPITKAAFADFGAAMKDPTLRFWAVEHGAGMILAAVVAHMTHIIVKRRTEDERAKLKRTLAGFGLALLIVCASVPWPFRDAVGRGWF